MLMKWKYTPEEQYVHTSVPYDAYSYRDGRDGHYRRRPCTPSCLQSTTSKQLYIRIDNKYSKANKVQHLILGMSEPLSHFYVPREHSGKRCKMEQGKGCHMGECEGGSNHLQQSTKCWYRKYKETKSFHKCSFNHQYICIIHTSISSIWSVKVRPKTKSWWGGLTFFIPVTQWVMLRFLYCSERRERQKKNEAMNSQRCKK